MQLDTLRVFMLSPGALSTFRAVAIGLAFAATGTNSRADAPLFDPVAARMIALSDSLGEGHSAPRQIRRVTSIEQTPSLARPTVRLEPEEEKQFGPKSAGRRYDSRMVSAARIARHRAEPRSTMYCWRYVKNALVESGVVGSRPTTTYAKQAGRELCEKYGFVKLPVRAAWDAPVGAVIVYGGHDAGHVEIRTESGFVSDFVSRTPFNRRPIGVFVKPS
jgi:hypothetical protein